jgi:hypothetical protein
MRAIKWILFGLLTIMAGVCFVAAAQSGHALRQRTNAMARAYQWQAPLPPTRVAEQVIDLEPATLEEEEAEAAATTPAPRPPRAVADPDDAYASILRTLMGPPPAPSPAPAPIVKKARLHVSPAPAAATVARNEVEPEDAIRIGLRSKRASFEHCYEQELKKQAAFSGFILVALSLSSSGRVTDARVQEGNRRDAVVGACIVAAIRTMKLPALTSEADLLIPIRLQAREPT